MNATSEKGRLRALVPIFIGVLAVWLYQVEVLGTGLAETAEMIKIQPVLDRHIESSLLWKLATSSAEWSARDSHAVFVFEDKMWLAGGISGNGLIQGSAVKYWEFPHFNDIWNTEDGVTWNRVVEHAEWPARRSMSIVPYDNRLWFFGGWSPVGSYQGDVWVSDDGISWKKVLDKAPWPKREGQVSLVFNGKLFMIGGVNYDLRKTYNDVWSTTDGVTWKEETAFAPWSSRWDHGVTELHGKLYLVAGMTLGGATFHDVWSSSDGATWELETNTPPWVSRQGLALIRYRGNLWMVGRLNDEFDGYGPNDIWYSSNGKEWNKTDVDPEWLGREDHAGYVFRNKMWIAGGMDNNEHWNNDIWYAELP